MDMEKVLALLDGGEGSGGFGAINSAVNVEKDYLGMSKEAELELGLGLSLGGGAAVKIKGSAAAVAWGESGSILTAKDLPNGFGGDGSRAGVSSGTKRERTSTDPQTVDSGTGSVGVGQVVGWPPIKSYRMNTLANQAKGSSDEGEKGIGKNEGFKKKANHGFDKNIANVKDKGCLGFVKVNMDGLQIGRKVDLNAHESYESLAQMLDEMFFKPSFSKCNKEEKANLLDASSEFVLTYEDKEGDWMLVGDVPWGMFLSTAKRLRIMRSLEANGLASKFQHMNEKQKG